MTVFRPSQGAALTWDLRTPLFLSATHLSYLEPELAGSAPQSSKAKGHQNRRPCFVGEGQKQAKNLPYCCPFLAGP